MFINYFKIIINSDLLHNQITIINLEIDIAINSFFKPGCKFLMEAINDDSNWTSIYRDKLLLFSYRYCLLQHVFSKQYKFMHFSIASEIFHYCVNSRKETLGWAPLKLQVHDNDFYAISNQSHELN